MFSRSIALLGPEAIQRLQEIRVILFGVGGVGSWCAEALVRTGLTHLTVVDPDIVCPSNCNRQLEATNLTQGQAKVEALKERLLTINPQAEITTIAQTYNAETSASFNLKQYDYIIDAIDSVRDKANLILEATSLPNTILFSSMGAALRIDSTKVCTDEFWRIKGDGLARALRNHFKRDQHFPSRKFLCVYSEEPPQPQTSEEAGDSHAIIKGSILPVTGTFGFTLVSLVLRDIKKSAK